MINSIEFTPPQQRIIRDVCLTHLASLERVYNKDSSVDVELVLAQHEVDPIDFKVSLSSTMERLNEVHSNPSILCTLEVEDISIFRHILFNVEDDYKDKYPNALSGLWQKLFLLEKFKVSVGVVPEAN